MLVIFDCDGVLVDTEATANACLAEWITGAGFPITTEACRRRFVGMTMDSVRAALLTEDGVDLGHDFPDRWNLNLPQLFAAGVEPIPHAIDLVAHLDALGVPFCVASSARVGKMKITLGSVGLLGRLEPVLFSATMVPRGKPFPDLFLHAAGAMGFKPDDCVVIEDAVPGVRAAVAAGMRVLAYHGDPAANADALAAAGGELIADLRKAPELLGLPGLRTTAEV